MPFKVTNPLFIDLIKANVSVYVKIQNTFVLLQ